MKVFGVAIIINPDDKKSIVDFKSVSEIIMTARNAHWSWIYNNTDRRYLCKS